jgi:hypothetical protein
MASVNIEYLIDSVRLELGDLVPESYRYLDEWILASLIASVRTLSRRWSSKYFVDSLGEVTRNSTTTTFEFTEAEQGIIQQKDERIIVIQASLILLQGSLESSAWNIGSWRDAELSVSNIASGDLRKDHIGSLRSELDSMIKPASKRLVNPIRTSYPINVYLEEAVQASAVDVVVE